MNYGYCYRMSYRRQKRWWNAYILFYEQVNEVPPMVEDKPIIKAMQELTIGNWFGDIFLV